jgi:hypothetical protein
MVLEYSSTEEVARKKLVPGKTTVEETAERMGQQDDEAGASEDIELVGGWRMFQVNRPGLSDAGPNRQ